MSVHPGILPRWAWLLLLPGLVRAEPVSFRTDVMQLLAKAGCNAGTCHGNAQGKGGFKLSLRGQDPDLDHQALTRDMYGRRVSLLDPDQSLILLKATTRVSHEGGLRFPIDSREHQVLRQWITEGAADDGDAAPRLVRLEVSPRHRILTAPDFRQPLQVTAVLSTGERRDVSHWAVYEASNTLVDIDPDGVVESAGPGETTVIVRYLGEQVPVRLAFIPARPDFEWSDPPANNFVDEHVFAKLRTLRMNPSALCTDAVFVRRAHLDLTGELPTAAEARAFVTSTEPDKRGRLVEALLEDPAFADYWAIKWSDLLRNEEKALDRKGVQAFHHWIRRSLLENKPLDQFVEEIVAARGSTYQVPPANYYRSLRTPIDRAEATAQLFLGTRLQCAKCHNHPFDRWTQADYYDWANLFARVNYKVLSNGRRDKFDKHEFVGEQVVWMDRKGSVTNPRTGQPASSRFLDMNGMADAPSASEGWAAAGPEAEDDPLVALAEWLTSPDNPVFAKSQVNRVWFHLMGGGIVEPIDDFRPTNPAINPELLEALTRDFIASGFDLRHLIRTIMGSRTYQLSAEPNDTNADDAINFSHAPIRRLTAEQLLDAIAQVSGVQPEFNGYPAGMTAAQIPGVQAMRPRDRRPAGGDLFLKLFGKPERLLSCECERSDETTMGQAFQLISGPTMNDLLTMPDNRLGHWIEGGASDHQVVESLYWTALSRPPDAWEMKAATALLASAPDRRAALEDLAWAVLNAKEFVLRQ